MQATRKAQFQLRGNGRERMSENLEPGSVQGCDWELRLSIYREVSEHHVAAYSKCWFIGWTRVWLVGRTCGQRWRRASTPRERSLVVHGMVTLFDWGADDKTVEELNRKYNTGKCDWIYEIEGFWSSCIRLCEEMSYSCYHRLCDFHFGYSSCCCCFVCVCQQASSGEAQFSSEPFVDRSREESVSRVVCPIFVKDASFYDPRNTSMLTSQRNSPHPRDTVQQPHLFSMFSLLVLTLLLAVVHSSIDDSWWWGPRMHHIFKRLF